MEESEKEGLGSESATSKLVAKRKQPEWFDIEEDKNTYVYVSGLPTTITEEEFISLMSKYGIIAKKSVQGNPYNVKLYKNKEGALKGDALCRYIKLESVELALTLLDGYQYDEQHTIHCERAKFELKGSYDPSKKPRIDQRTREKQKKAVDRLLSWEPKLPPEMKQKKVIFKNMFSPDDMLQDPTSILDLKEEIEQQCSDVISEPNRVEIFDKHPEGVIAVTFVEPQQAQACVKAFNNRTFDGRVITVELWDGRTKYKVRETDEESERRLERLKEDIQKSDLFDGPSEDQISEKHGEEEGQTSGTNDNENDDRSRTLI